MFASQPSRVLITSKPCPSITLRLITLLLLTSLIAACSDAPEATKNTAANPGLVVQHASGTTTLTRLPPHKVMVTDWAAFDQLTALGVPIAGIPGGPIPGHLADKVSPQMQRIGSLVEPDIEAIVAAQPDLLVVGARSRTSYPTLTKLVPTLDVSVDNNDLIGEVQNYLRIYGEIFNLEAKAAEINAQLDAKIEEAKLATANKGKVLVLVTNGGRMGVYGPQSRVSWLYNNLHLPTVAQEVDDRDHGGDSITFEYLLKTNPDWLIVIDRDAGIGNTGSAYQLLNNELVHQTKFWQNERIIYLDSAAAYMTMHGPSALMLLLDQVINGFTALD